MRRTILRRRALAVEKKLVFLDAFASSRLLFQAGSWFGGTDVNVRALEAPYIDALRVATGNTRFDETKMFAATNLVVRREACRIDMTSQLRCARLAFLPRVLRNSPPHLLGILDIQLSLKRGWAAQLVGDLAWIADIVSQCDAEADMVCLLNRGLSDVMAFAFASPKRWKDFVKRVLRRHCLAAQASPRRPDQPDLDGIHHLRDPHDREGISNFCYECGFLACTARGLKAHLRLAHDMRLSGASFAPESGICDSCHTCFWTRPRLIRHLNHSCKHCLVWLQDHSSPFPTEEVERLDSLDSVQRRVLKAKGLREFHSERPPVRVCGPWQRL